MKTLGTVVLALLAIMASLVLVLSSLCVFGGPVGSGDRTPFVICALLALAVVVAAILGIAKLNRKP
jgi:hypothetical protein